MFQNIYWPSFNPQVFIGVGKSCHVFYRARVSCTLAKFHIIEKGVTMAYGGTHTQFDKGRQGTQKRCSASSNAENSGLSSEEQSSKFGRMVDALPVLKLLPREKFIRLEIELGSFSLF